MAALAKEAVRRHGLERGEPACEGRRAIGAGAGRAGGSCQTAGTGLVRPVCVRAALLQLRGVVAVVGSCQTVGTGLVRPADADAGWCRCVSQQS